MQHFHSPVIERMAIRILIRYSSRVALQRPTNVSRYPVPSREMTQKHWLIKIQSKWKFAVKIFMHKLLAIWWINLSVGYSYHCFFRHISILCAMIMLRWSMGMRKKEYTLNYSYKPPPPTIPTSVSSSSSPLPSTQQPRTAVVGTSEVHISRHLISPHLITQGVRT